MILLKVFAPICFIFALICLGVAIRMGKKSKPKFRDTGGWGQSRPYRY